MLGTFQAQDWVENFRMRKETFDYLCHRLYPLIHRNDTVMHKAISVQRRLAITLWCLATPAEYRTISHLFGVATVDPVFVKLSRKHALQLWTLF